jgi:hypothetical protein
MEAVPWINDVTSEVTNGFERHAAWVTEQTSPELAGELLGM